MLRTSVVAEAEGRQGVGDARKVGGSADFDGDLLAAQAAVHVGADADVAGVAGQVAHVPHVADDIGQRRPAFAVLAGGSRNLSKKLMPITPPRLAMAPDHVIGKLPIGRHDRRGNWNATR